MPGGDSCCRLGERDFLPSLRRLPMAARENRAFFCDQMHLDGVEEALKLGGRREVSGGWLLLDRFDSVAHIGRINSPLLIMQGSQDSVIPASSSRALFDAAAAATGIPPPASTLAGWRPFAVYRRHHPLRQSLCMKLQTAPYIEQTRLWPAQGRHILAHYDAETIVVYQAHIPSIGRYAVQHGRFGGDFSYSRMTGSSRISFG